MSKFEKKFSSITRAFNWAAMASVTAMMLLTCADVIMRCFRRPIPGTYEIVGLLGAMFVSFSLAHTSMERGHIAVDFLVQKLSQKTCRIIDFINSFISAILFGLIAWQSFLYAGDLQTAGEVSMTLQLPLYPFVYGVALGCGLVCLTLVSRVLGIFLNSSDNY